MSAFLQGAETITFFAPFFRDLRNVTAFSADLDGNHKGAFGLYKLARQLNKGNSFYAVVDLHSVLRSKILKKFIRCKRFVSIDKGRKMKKALTLGAFFEPLKTTHQRYADVFKTLGYPIDLSNPSFPEKGILSEKVKTIIGDDSQKMIGIAPFAAHEGKIYPLDLMKAVIEALSKDYKVILFGGEKEISVLDSFQNTFKNVINISGKLSIDEELDLISNLKAMNSTIIFVAHRLKIAKHADQIFVMQSGEIVERGTHEELLSYEKFYAKMWQAMS